MADATIDTPVEKPKRSRKGLILMIGFVVVMAAAGFSASFLGLVQGLLTGGESAVDDHGETVGAPSFVPIEPITMVIPGSPPRQFRLSAQIEVGPDQAASVVALMPRVQNVLQGFLRAVEPDALADRAAWFDLRLQMLYRVRMVLGEATVRDLLITDFIVN